MIFTLLKNICAASNAINNSLDIIPQEHNSLNVSCFSGFNNILEKTFTRKIVEIQTDDGMNIEIDIYQNKHDFLCDISSNAPQIRKNLGLMKVFGLYKLKNIMNENKEVISRMKSSNNNVQKFNAIVREQQKIYKILFELMKIKKVKSYVGLYNNIATMRYAFTNKLNLEGIDITKNILEQIHKIKRKQNLSPLLQYFERQEELFEKKYATMDVTNFKIQYGLFKMKQTLFESSIRKENEK